MLMIGSMGKDGRKRRCRMFVAMVYRDDDRERLKGDSSLMRIRKTPVRSDQ